ncbi:MAG: sulfotransferase family protein [Pseudomonadota bacterium]
MALAEEERGEFFRNWMKNQRPHLDYLVNWSPKHRFIYVETPKVACTTVKRVLQRAEVEGDTARLPDNVHDRASSPLKKPSEDLDGFIKDLEDPGVLLFCFVRDPFTRALSCYLDKFVSNQWERNRLGPELGFERGEEVSFERFLRAVADQEPMQRDIHWMTQCDLIRPRKMKYDFIGRFENFAADFQSVLTALQLDGGEETSQRHNVTDASGKAASHFGPEEVSLVRSIYAADFDHYGYGGQPLARFLAEPASAG